MLSKGLFQAIRPSVSLLRMGTTRNFSSIPVKGPYGYNTTGDYKDLPKPDPRGYIALISGPKSKIFWYGLFAWASVFLLYPFPIPLLPFFQSQRKAMKKADDDFGPTRYGVGKDVASGGV